MTYQEYLQTPEWREIALAVRARAGYRCQLCNSDSNLQAHHRSYQFIFKEKEHLDDLICLCDDCHAKFHGKSSHKPAPQRVGMGMARAKKPIPNATNDRMVRITKKLSRQIMAHREVWHWMKREGIDPTRAGWRKRIIGRLVPSSWIGHTPGVFTTWEQDKWTVVPESRDAPKPWGYGSRMRRGRYL